MALATADLREPPRLPSWLTTMIGGLALAAVLNLASSIWWASRVNTLLDNHNDRLVALELADKARDQRRVELYSRVSALEANWTAIRDALDRIDRNTGGTR